MADPDALLDRYDQLEGKLGSLFDQFKGVIYLTWGKASETMNEGQHTILREHISPFIGEYLDEAQVDWPDVSVDQYVSGLFQCYDTEVMFRSFDLTIYDPI